MPWYDKTLFCEDLPTAPALDVGTILVTGATGYVGGRLATELLERGYRVRVMVRRESPEHRERWPGAEIAVADALDESSLKEALSGIHTAYYLIHSLLLGPEKFAQADRDAAGRFRRVAEECHLKRLIYLGGLGDESASLSPHLTSRIQIAQELQRGAVPVTILRAAIIIGSGSASYEIIRSLVTGSPLIIYSRFVRTKCQPIGIRDVIKYLVGVLESPETTGESYDIGGKDIMTYPEMMKVMTEVMGIKKRFVFLPLLNVKWLSYLTSLCTPVPANITRCLMEGIVNDVVCRSDAIRTIIPFTPATYRETVMKALARERREKVHSRWSDAYPRGHLLAEKLSDLKTPPNHISSYDLLTDKEAESIFFSISRIGGEQGWFRTDWMWKLRGVMDSLVMGVGISRGRRLTRTLRINDVIDFWRVENLVKNRLVLLRAEMKVPGQAWLEFRIDPEGDKRRLTVTAYFKSRGLMGKAYWYAFLPFHFFIFNDLIRQIEKRCR